MNLPLAIVSVKSRRTGREYYVGVPSADTDMATDGLLVLTSKEKKEIFLCMALAEEYPLGPDEASRRCAIRLQEKLRRSDLAPVLLNLEEPAIKATWQDGRSFKVPAAQAHWRDSEFSSWRFAFTDIYDEDDFADPVSELSCEEFIATGGVIIDSRNENGG